MTKNRNLSSHRLGQDHTHGAGSLFYRPGSTRSTRFAGKTALELYRPGSTRSTSIELERALRVLDGAILVLCSVGGVQSQSITVDRQMRRYVVPRLALINKLDRMGADPWKVLNQARSKLRHHAAAVQVPIGLEENFMGLVDLVHQKTYYFHGSSGENVVTEEISADMEAIVAEKRREPIEMFSEVDDKLAEAFLNDEPISPADLEEPVRRATIARNNYALNQTKNEEKVMLPGTPDGPLVALAFKLEEGRVYEGVVQKGDFIVNVNTGKKIKVDATIGKPHVNFRDTITQRAEFDYLHKKQSGGQGQYGRVCGCVEPLTPGPLVKFEFENMIVGQAIPSNFIPAIDKCFIEAANSGSLIGHPVENIRIVTTDGASHAVDSSELAFKLAAIYAFRKCYTAARPVILEPIMLIELKVPTEFQGTVADDINKRKGVIVGNDQDGDDSIITANASTIEQYVRLLNSTSIDDKVKANSQWNTRSIYQFLRTCKYS
ncbi:Elongation factor G [Hibiscus syriacus]|uniref:Elongation factor G n=1 Tax=Hibiscus syriacus TaxID=106335 RepID=A0A6A3BZZ6_HIBSY|nr:Elongation factor G [Hibiscus syriacus]